MGFQGPMPSQHPTGQFHGHNAMTHGFPGHQQQSHPHDETFNEQLAFFSIHRPLSAKSWDDATPVQHRLASSEIRKSLAKLQHNRPTSVKDTLMNLKSDSARRVINALVEEQNDKLSQSDPTSEWIIAGIDVQKELVKQWPSQKKIIKCIEVFLKTEPAQDFDDDQFGAPPLQDPFEGGGACVNHGHRNLQQHGSNMIDAEPQVIRTVPSMGNLQFHDHGHERDPVPVREEFPPPPHHVQRGPAHGVHPHGGANQAHNHGAPGQGQNPHLGSHPGQQVHGSAHAFQHHGDGGIPPPPPHGPPPNQHAGPQVVPPPFDPHEQPRHMSAGHPEPMSVHGAMPGQHFAPPEILDPHMLKHQKSKSKSLRREYHVLQEPESESESGNSDSGSHFSSRSVEDGAYGFVERSRTRGRKRSQTRSRGRSAPRSRSNDRVRLPKVYNVKKSHGRTRSDVEIIHEDRPKFSSKDSSPRSSAAAIPTQPIINVHIDNGNEHTRERTGDRGREVYTSEHDPRHSGNPMPTPGFSYPVYAKNDRFDAHPMSRHSSIGGSDTGSSVIDGHSSVYTSDDSIFSEPIRPRLHSRTTSEVGAGPQLRSRNMPLPRDEAFIPPYRQQKPRFPVDDYPHAHRPRGSLHEDRIEPHRSRGSLHEDRIEPHRSSTHRRPSMSARRHSVQIGNPFNPRYAHPSRSYNEVLPSYAYKPEPPPQRYIADDRPNPFELRAMADQLEAMDYINHSRRSGMPSRRNSMRGRMAPEVDEWAYRPPMYDAYRHV
ncbi:hypothetical protein BU23DRAFT_570287 [Bimuria novae-zelandiae CBS 107.79]|uniref:Uncharacterized protein n=1 Tax=Bimuria novae-zelandiae CBS 107.79 TaxID=1447943 RepID=A0A6A5V1A6_9PLEO|nr:hypothetical protein BU23DRAFT_570287 [Bimuria novae-zelandiae CBS 107.79]